MYALASKLIHLPVLSLQSAETLTQVETIILNPDRLTIAAFACTQVQRDQPKPVLMPGDVRQIALDCVLVDAPDVIGDASEVVRLAPLAANPYQLSGKRVVTEMRRALGKVEDYVINLETYEVQKLEVRPSFMQSWLSGSLMIDRRQIVEVTGREIVVREATTSTPINERWLGHKTATKP